MQLFNKIKSLLDQYNIDYKIKHHPPTRTSEESAKYRNESIKIGAKALVVKSKDKFYLAVLPADKKLDTKKLKKILKSKKLRFATEDELRNLTGLVPGSVPPFGDLMGINMIVDETQFEQEDIAFNAGSLEISIKMKSKDYKKLLQPKSADFSSNG